MRLKFIADPPSPRRRRANPAQWSGKPAFVLPPPGPISHIVTRKRLAYKRAGSREKRGILQVLAKRWSLATCAACRPHSEPEKRPRRPAASQFGVRHILLRQGCGGQGMATDGQRNADITAKAELAFRTPRRFAVTARDRTAARSWGARATAPLSHWPPPPGNSLQTGKGNKCDGHRPPLQVEARISQIHHSPLAPPAEKDSTEQTKATKRNSPFVFFAPFCSTEIREIREIRGEPSAK